ncbi:MAG: hypothetical protein HYX94_05400 [Chloroflexi bacterium]|nr:hypothetical protein [Chloroflexota bacterium]
MKKLGTLVKLVGVSLVAAAVTQELRKPPEERTWHGRVAGFVPYDFRVPSLDKVKETYWNPDKPQIFSERVLGVGWGINFGRLYKMARECRGCETCGQSPETDQGQSAA